MLRTRRRTTSPAGDEPPHHGASGRAARFIAVALVACASCSCASAPAPSAASSAAAAGATNAGAIRYALTLRTDWTLEQRVCFDDARVRVMPAVRVAIPFLKSATDAAGHALPADRDGVDVRALENGGCVTLVLDLAAAARSLNDDDTLREANGVLLGSPDIWLWRPEPWPEDSVASLTLVLPDGVSASLPFPKRADGTYSVRKATWRLMAKSAFGRFDTVTTTVAHAEVHIAKLGPISTPDADLAAWLDSAAGAVGTVLGRFPHPQVQILVVPVPSPEAVPFGMAMRGGGPTVMLLVGRDAKKSELIGEWVLVHELSHLLLPPFTDEGSWFAEGSASYFQQILRARTGLLDEADAWEGLVDGFGRGRNGAGETTLAEAAADLHRRHAYQQVYWGGAAILFLLDVELRERGASLDEAIGAVRAVEPNDTALRTPDEVLAVMQRVAGDLDLRAFVAERLAAPFPDTAAALEDLGVRVDKQGRVRLVDAPHAAIRTGISGRR